jgi:hypothetical protein
MRGPPNLLRKSAPPRPASRRLAASLTAAPPPAPEAPSSIKKTDKETAMTMISSMTNGRSEAIVDALRAEFGAILAERILEAEAVDFLWDARVEERYLGQHFDVGLSIDEGEIELTRIAILSFLGDRWHTGTCLVDGEGRAADLLWNESFGNREEAEAAFDRAA